MVSVTAPYARIINGEITEIPVPYLHIQNRQHPLYWYVPVISADKPTVFDYQYTYPIYKYSKYAGQANDYPNGAVYEQWIVEDYELNDLLIKIRTDKDLSAIEAPALDLQELKPETLKQVMSLIVSLATQKLDAWAALKGYDNIDTLISYGESGNTTYATQARQGVDVRDKMWTALEAYQAAIIIGTKKVPIDQNEVEQNLPSLTW